MVVLHGRYSLAWTEGNWEFWLREEGDRDGKSWCNYFWQELEPKQQERVSFQALWQRNFLICHWVCVKKWLVGLYIYRDYSQIHNLHNIYSTLSTMSPYIMCICIIYICMLYNASLEALTGSAKYFLIYLAIFTYFFSPSVEWTLLRGAGLWPEYNRPTKCVSAPNSLGKPHENHATLSHNPSPISPATRRHTENFLFHCFYC